MYAVKTFNYDEVEYVFELHNKSETVLIVEIFLSIFFSCSYENKKQLKVLICLWNTVDISGHLLLKSLSFNSVLN